MTILEVPGARLSYEIRGAGPVMLLIPGASGAGDSFQRVTQFLAPHYTVVTYDRRGFSHSQLNRPQDYAQRLETDADDVRSLLEKASGEPAVVFGSSSGAIVALEVLIRHPAVVRTLVAHEPPAMRLLPGGQKWIDVFHDVFELYGRAGPLPALEKFRESAFGEADRRAMAAAPRNEYTLTNGAYWFEHELRQYPAAELDMERLTALADRIMVAAGRESRGTPTHDVSVELCRRLGRDLVELPGGHVGFLTHPAEFARELLEALAAANAAS